MWPVSPQRLHFKLLPSELPAFPPPALLRDDFVCCPSSSSSSCFLCPPRPRPPRPFARPRAPDAGFRFPPKSRVTYSNEGMSDVLSCSAGECARNKILRSTSEVSAKLESFSMCFYFVIGETKRFYVCICEGRVCDGYSSGICENIANPEALCKHGHLLLE